MRGDLNRAAPLAMSPLFFLNFGTAIALGLDPSSARDSGAPEVRSLPGDEKLPVWRGDPPRGGREPAALPARRHLFGIGIGFERSGNAQGVALSQVLAGSPAERAGLTAGIVIAEINGVSIVGRAGDDCAQAVRDAPGKVTLKFFDPTTLKLRTLTLEKELLVLPN